MSLGAFLRRRGWRRRCLTSDVARARSGFASRLRTGHTQPGHARLPSPPAPPPIVGSPTLCRPLLRAANGGGLHLQ